MNWKKLREDLTFFVEKFFWYLDFAIHCRGSRNEIFWRKLYGNLIGCASDKCIFNVDLYCENPVQYKIWGGPEKRDYKGIISCSNGIWRRKRDDDWARYPK